MRNLPAWAPTVFWVALGLLLALGFMTLPSIGWALLAAPAILLVLGFIRRIDTTGWPYMFLAGGLIRLLLDPKTFLWSGLWLTDVDLVFPLPRFRSGPGLDEPS